MGIRNSFQLRFWTWTISGARGIEIHRGASWSYEWSFPTNSPHDHTIVLGDYWGKFTNKELAILETLSLENEVRTNAWTM